MTPELLREMLAVGETPSVEFKGGESQPTLRRLSSPAVASARAPAVS